MERLVEMHRTAVGISVFAEADINATKKKREREVFNDILKYQIEQQHGE